MLKAAKGTARAGIKNTRIEIGGEIYALWSGQDLDNDRRISVFAA